MFAVYREMDGKRLLCKIWNEGIGTYTEAVFVDRPDAELFAKAMAKLEGNEIYKYVVVHVAITSCEY